MISGFKAHLSQKYGLVVSMFLNWNILKVHKSYNSVPNEDLHVINRSKV